MQTSRNQKPPKMTRQKNHRIVVALRLATQAGQRTLQGLYRYLAETGTHWDIRIKRDSDEFGLENVARYRNWGIDGIVFGMCAPDSRLDASIAEIAAQPIPIVAVDVRDQPALEQRNAPVSFINTDTESVGAEAAGFFLRQGGYKSFGYVPDFRGRTWSARRGDAFAAELARQGFACARYAHPPLDADDFEDFKAWVSALPKPMALFVACDDQALTILENCRVLGLRIPRDVSILGVDDDEVIDESCVPTLSSVHPNHERQGYLAAARLNDLLAGKADVPRHTEIPILNISARNSTRNESPAGVLVQGALSYIAQNARHGISPADVARQLKVSRRLLDLRFRAIAGVSVSAAIRDQQLADVRDRLAHTNDTIDAISASCGFANANYLKDLFKRRYGVTMRDWRLAVLSRARR